MNPQEDSLINLSVGESSDPEMLRRDAESKTGSRPSEESFVPERSGGGTDLETATHPTEEDREETPDLDFNTARKDTPTDGPINIASLNGG